MDKIIADVSVDVTLIKWQPRDVHGRIYYGYNESVYHCMRTYGQQTEWMVFIDVDEFLFSPSGIDMREKLSDLQAHGVQQADHSAKEVLGPIPESQQIRNRYL